MLSGLGERASKRRRYCGSGSSSSSSRTIACVSFLAVQHSVLSGRRKGCDSEAATGEDKRHSCAVKMQVRSKQARQKARRRRVIRKKSGKRPRASCRERTAPAKVEKGTKERRCERTKGKGAKERRSEGVVMVMVMVKRRGTRRKGT